MSLSMLYRSGPARAYQADETADEIIGGYTKIIRKKPKKELPAYEPSSEMTNVQPVIVYEAGAFAVPVAQSVFDSLSAGDLETASPADRAAFSRLQASSQAEVLPVRSLDDRSTLRFNSHFESGNLQRATKHSAFEYWLELRKDSNTDKHNHWYYFSVQNTMRGEVTFRIVNMRKFDYLYTVGMKPAVYSLKGDQLTQTGWHRSGHSVSYTKNEEGFFTLSFTYDFQYLDDTVYFAYSVPYTYAELQEFNQKIKLESSAIARVDPLCYTLGGNVCEMITITRNIASYTSFEEEQHLWGLSASGRKFFRARQRRANKSSSEHSRKKGVVITARVHSGEAVSSYMALGVLDFLLGNSREARLLRKHFVFKVVPMLNPDGVIYGNYRCSLLGIDLNRRWKRPHKNLHPTIFFTKKMLEVLQESHGLALYCDLHGHTRQRNVFMYGCSVKSTDLLDLRRNLLAKVIPTIFEQKNPFFSMKNSHFTVHPSKEATGRVVVFRQFGVPHSYTMEASFYGPSTSRAFGKHYTGDLHLQPTHLQGVGRDLCKLCLTFISEPLYAKRIRFTNTCLRKQWLPKEKPPDIDLKFSEIKETATLTPKPTEETAECWETLELSDYNSSGSDDSGSDSDVTVEHLAEEPQWVELSKTPAKTPSQTPPNYRQTPPGVLKKGFDPPRLHVKRNSMKLNRTTIEETRKPDIEPEALPMNQLNMLDFFRDMDKTTPKAAVDSRKRKGKSALKPRQNVVPLNKLSLPKMNYKSMISARARPTSEAGGVFYQAQQHPLDFSGSTPKELARSLAMHKRYLAHKYALDTRQFQFN